MGRNVLGRYDNSVYIEKNEWSPSSLHVDALSARLGEWSNVLFKSRRPQFSAAGRRADVPLFFASRRRGPTYTPYSLPGPSLHVASSFHAAVIHTDSQSSLHLSLSEKLRYAPPADHSHGTCAGSYRGARLARFLLALHHTHRTNTKTITTNLPYPPCSFVSLTKSPTAHTHTPQKDAHPLSPLFRTTPARLFSRTRFANTAATPIQTPNHQTPQSPSFKSSFPLAPSSLLSSVVAWRFGRATSPSSSFCHQCSSSSCLIIIFTK